jgi:hypothetical protein
MSIGFRACLARREAREPPGDSHQSTYLIAESFIAVSREPPATKRTCACLRYPAAVSAEGRPKKLLGLECQPLTSRILLQDIHTRESEY